ncbi:MAG TPA: DedA family protein [Xanthobacteraceae bacterium]|nr:DedA family protein [Xanthobacteraceae bacterium]
MDIVSTIVEWTNQHLEFAYASVFLMALLESVPFLGGFVPGSAAIVGISTLAVAGAVRPWAIIVVAMIGAIMGDGLSYWLGYRYGGTIRGIWPLSREPELIARSEAFFHRYGRISVFFARFVPPVRALIPVVAGVLQMPPHAFVAANAAAAFGWSLVHVLLGLAIGNSLTFFEGHPERGTVVFVLVLAGFGILTWAVSRFFRRA